MTQDVPHGGGRDVSVLLGRRNDDGLDFGREPAVGIGYGPFALEIKHVAHASYDVVNPHLATHVYGETVIFDYADALHAVGGLTYYGHPLVHVVESGLVLVDAYCDDHGVEHRERPLEYVEVSRSERIEGSGEKCYSCQFMGVLFSDAKIAFVFEK